MAVVAGATSRPASASPSAAPAGSPDFPAIDRFVRNQLSAQAIPGAALVVTHGPDVVHVRGFGHTSAGTPVTPRTQFRLGSVSKSFTATAVLQLVDAGRIRLDDPVRTYLPKFAVDDPRGARITVRHLLNHTSGLSDQGFPEQTLPAPHDLAERIISLRTAKLTSAPGTEFHYFNPNYDVAARIVEVASGQPFATYLREHVFTPLRMNDTLLAYTKLIPSNAPRLYRGYALAFTRPVVRPEPDGFLGGNGAVVSTAADLGHWLAMQNSRGRYAGRQVVSAASLETEHTPPTGPTGPAGPPGPTAPTGPGGAATTYAMGWTAERPEGGQPRLTHNGVLSTYYAEQALVPGTGYGVALMFNTSNGLVPYHAITEGVLAQLEGREPASVQPPMRLVEYALAALTVLTLLVRCWEILRAGAWARRRRTRPLWRVVPGMVWLAVPAVLLAGLPWLVGRFAGRVFTREMLFWSMVTVHLWLGVAAVTGLVLITIRVAALVRTKSAPTPEAP
nr:serine hydrolase domain-containing protein [Actinopolymorpha cephalotaxi]